METPLRNVQRLMVLTFAAFLSASSISHAVPLTNGGLLNSWETADTLDTEGWYGLNWNYPVDWYSSSDTATDGTKSLQAIYTSTGASNFNWSLKFASYDLLLITPEQRTAWETPWREALADNPSHYSLTFDVIFRTKSPGKPGVPSTPTWANVAVAMDWDAPVESGGFSGWTQWGSLGNAWVDQDQAVTVKIPLNTIIGGGNNAPLPADFWWIQLHFGLNGGWASGEEATIYFDNLRIVQDIFPPMRLAGDVNGDGFVNAADINPFIYALSNAEAAFQIEYPAGVYFNADVNGDAFAGDGFINAADINPFVLLLSGTGEPGIAAALAAVPEPASGLLAIGALALACRRRR